MANKGSVNAQYIIGEMYEEGRGVEQSNEKAFEWYYKAQKNGHEDAATRIQLLETKIERNKLKKQEKIKKAKAAKAAKLAKLKAKSVIKKKKIVKPKKQVKVTKPVKKKIVNTPKIKTEVIQAKPKRVASPPTNINRSKGTHLDDFEESFD